MRTSWMCGSTLFQTVRFTRVSSTLWIFLCFIIIDIRASDSTSLRDLAARMTAYERAGLYDSAIYIGEPVFERIVEDRSNDSMLIVIGSSLVRSYPRSEQMERGDSLAEMLLQRADNRFAVLRGGLYHMRGYCAFFTGRFEDAKGYYQRSAAIFDTIQDWTWKAHSLNNLFIVYHELNNPVREIEILSEILALEQEQENNYGIARCYLNLSQCYYDSDYPEEAEKALLTSLALIESDSLERLAPYVLSGLANIYGDRGLCDTAITIYKKVLTISTSIPDIQAQANSGIQACYLDAGDYENGLPYAEAAMEWADEIYDIHHQARIFSNYGKVLVFLGRYEEALPHLEKAKKLGDEYEFWDVSIESQKILAIAYRSLKRYELALENMTRSYALADSIRELEQTDRFAQLQAQYQSLEKEKENELLRQENELNEATIARQELLNLATFGGVTFLALLTLVILINQRKLQRTNRLLDQQKQELEAKQALLGQSNSTLLELNENRERLIAIIAHDLRGPVGSLGQLLELAQEDLKEGEDISELLQTSLKASYAAQNLLQDLLDWVSERQGLSKFEPAPLVLHDLIESVLDLLGNQARSKDIRLTHSVPEHFRVHADRSMLETIVRNLVSNAVKFTHKEGMVKIRAAAEDEEHILLEVIDNGVGMSPEKVETLFEQDQFQSTFGTENEKGIGLGLALSQGLARKHGTELKVVSKQGKGSTFSISLTKA